MAVTFMTGIHAVWGNQKGEIQLFLENDIDDDLDVKTAARAQNVVEGEARVTSGWHEAGPQEHLTVEVWIHRRHLYTAHVFRNGQITAYS